MFNQNNAQTKIMTLWTKHLSDKKQQDYRKMLSSDENISDVATEFYAIMPNDLKNHFSLEKMIGFAVSQRQDTMKRARSQKKTFGRVIKKNSSDFSDIDLTEFGL
jgi:hypothetical protein